MKLTHEQKLITRHLQGHAMVKAGPGCAKTSTLALRVQHMLDLEYEPSSIVILTYGKALPLDIVNTLSKFISPEVAKQITVSTIHSFAYRLLKTDCQSVGHVPPRALNQQRKERFLKDRAKRTGVKLKELKQAFNHYDSRIKSGKIEAMLGNDKAKKAKMAYKSYSNYKSKRNKVDFKDMIRDAIKLLKQHPDQDSTLLCSYQHLMVDELQDIDRAQKELLLLLAMRMESTVIVGDPLQSIYGWRRSLPRYWHDIEKALVPKQFELTQSFRIPRQALALVNDLGRKIDPDAPVLTSTFDGSKPKLWEFADQDQQHWYMAKEIKRLLSNGVEIHQIAILGKTRKELSQTALALRARNTEVTERYGLNAAANNDRHRRQIHVHVHKTHLLALIQLTRLEQLRRSRPTKTQTRDQQALTRDWIENLWLPKKTIQLIQERLTVKPKAILSIASDDPSYDRINDLSNAIEKAAGLGIESALQCLIDASKPVLKDRDDRHHKLRVRDLTDIKIMARNCMTMEDIKTEWFEPTTVDDGVQLMTIHAAKGQEWEYVFVLNVVEGIIPRYQATDTKALEELRVFYVAVTRHHKGLYVLQTPTPTRKLVKKSGSGSSSQPVLFKERSSFIDIDKQGLDFRSYV